MSRQTRLLRAGALGPMRCWGLHRAASTAPPLTTQQKQFSALKRGNYAKLTDRDIQAFERIMPGRVLVADADKEAYNTDWMRKYRGTAAVVLRPKTTEEVSAAMRYCSDHTLAVVPQGGNTGLVGGSVPVFDEVVLSTSLMKSILAIDKESRVLTCQAGCTLASLDQELSKQDLMMPLDLGAKGSCQIGGNISTNAGGLRYLRYGSLHGTVLGLETVLADGTVLDNLVTLRKDNTGYDLKQLFIGSEGTLGIITAAAIGVVQRLASVNVAFFSCSSFEHVLQLVNHARAHLGEILSAVEFLDAEGLACVKENAGLQSPLPDPAPFYVLIETHGSNMDHDQEKLQSFVEVAMDKQVATDGTVAQDGRQGAAIWQVRERISESLQHDGWVYKYDVSLPLKSFYELVELMRQRVSGLAKRCVGFGHLGDGNLHLNVTSREPRDELLARIEPFIYEFTAKCRGSISAEHGLGLMKPHHIHYSKTDASVQLMKRMKGLMDPKGILNPYKTLP